METLSVHVMNTDYFIALPTGLSQNWKKPIQKWLYYVEKEWSRFQKGNELDKLNQLQIGEKIQLSHALYTCIQRANDYYLQTNSLFSPYLKSQLEQHGYNQSFPFYKTEKHSLVSPINLQAPIQFLNHHFVVKTGEQQIDLGGFAKGFIVEKIVLWLKQKTSAEYGMVDGGGDMSVWSNGEKEWNIGIANPYNDHEKMSYIKIKNGAIATSNRVYRSWTQGEEKKHHLLNGQTGEVAKTDIVQATIVTKSLCDAEVMTKLSFLINETKIRHWAEKNHIQYAQFIVKEHGAHYWTLGGKKSYGS